MSRSRSQRRRIYHRASAIARDIRTADYPDAVNIVARLIAGTMTRKRSALAPDVLDAQPMSADERKIWNRANPNLKPSTGIVMVEGTIPVSEPLARELVRQGLLTVGDKGPEVAVQRINISDKDSKFLESQRWVSCDHDCSRIRECWPSCCKIIDESGENPPRIARGVRMDDVFEPMGPDSFGGEDGMHSPAAETIRRQIEERFRK